MKSKYFVTTAERYKAHPFMPCRLPEMLSEAQSDQYWKDLMVQILRTHARVNADFDVTASENATWQTVVAVLDDYAKQQGIFSPR